jgi:hypothetical protein
MSVLRQAAIPMATARTEALALLQRARERAEQRKAAGTERKTVAVVMSV